jgi:hypothetical protein
MAVLLSEAAEITQLKAWLRAETSVSGISNFLPQKVVILATLG